MRTFRELGYLQDLDMLTVVGCERDSDQQQKSEQESSHAQKIVLSSITTTIEVHLCLSIFRRLTEPHAANASMSFLTAMDRVASISFSNNCHIHLKMKRTRASKAEPSSKHVLTGLYDRKSSQGAKTFIHFLLQ